MLSLIPTDTIIRMRQKEQLQRQAGRFILHCSGCLIKLCDRTAPNINQYSMYQHQQQHTSTQSPSKIKPCLFVGGSACVTKRPPLLFSLQPGIPLSRNLISSFRHHLIANLRSPQSKKSPRCSPRRVCKGQYLLSLCCFAAIVQEFVCLDLGLFC